MVEVNGRILQTGMPECRVVEKTWNAALAFNALRPRTKVPFY